MTKPHRFTLIFIACVLFVSCNAQGTPKKGTKLKIPVRLIASSEKSGSFHAEVARTPEERTHGLSFRKELKPDQAMLFVFKTEKIHKFWMKNTFISLDIIFMDSKKTILGCIERARPQDETILSIGFPSTYALEVNAGVCDELKITPFKSKAEFTLPVAK